MTPQPPARNCPRCGAALSLEAIFCGQCGLPLNAAPPPAASQPLVPMPPPQVIWYPPPPRKEFPWLTVGVIVVLVIIILLSIALFDSVTKSILHNLYRYFR